MNKINLQWNNNTLKVRHKELEVDTSLLVCTLHKPESCIGVHSSKLLRTGFEMEEPCIFASKQEATTGLACLLRKVGFVASGRDPVIGKLKSPPLHAWLHALCRSDDTVPTLARSVANFAAGTRCVRVGEDACRELDRYNVWGEAAWIIFAEEHNSWAVNHCQSRILTSLACPQLKTQIFSLNTWVIVFAACGCHEQTAFRFLNY